MDLHEGFALNQALSAFALAALDLLDPADPGYALDVVSVIEATLEDPRPVLMAQQFEARGEAVAAMKADGLDYEERMEALDDVTWPRPLADLLEQSLRTYRQTHPWVDPSDLAPKSGVLGQVDRSHAAVPQRPDDPEMLQHFGERPGGAGGGLVRQRRVACGDGRVAARVRLWVAG